MFAARPHTYHIVGKSKKEPEEEQEHEKKTVTQTVTTVNGETTVHIHVLRDELILANSNKIK